MEKTLNQKGKAMMTTKKPSKKANSVKSGASQKLILASRRLEKLTAPKKQAKKSQKSNRQVFASSVMGVTLLLSAVAVFAFSLTPTLRNDVLGTTVSLTAPNAPTNIAAKVKNSTVTLTWNDSATEAADKYVVYRYDDVSGQYVAAPKNQILSSFSKKYISSENDSGKTYLYKVAGVRLISADGSSAATELFSPLSRAISIKIPVIKAPKTPTKLTAKVKNSLITLSWTGSGDGYDVERYDATLKKYVSEQGGEDISAKSFSSRVYEPGTSYRFRVSAYNSVYSAGVAQDSLRSPGYIALTVKVPAAIAPSAPTGLRSKAENGIVTLTWNNPSRYSYSGAIIYDISGADGYRVMAYSAIAEEWYDIDPKSLKFASDRSVTISDQDTGTTRQYKVAAYKKIYSGLTRDIVNLEGKYTKPISVKMP